MAQQDQQDRTEVRQLRQSHSPLRILRANVYDLGALLRDAIYAIIGFLIIMTLGALYMNAYTDRKGAEAVYESLKLLTFQSSERLPANDPLGDFLFFAAPIIGLVLVTQGVISFGRRLVDKSSRRELWQVSLARTFHNHVIVCGLGRVGLRVTTHLIEAGYEVVVIQRNWQDAPVQRALRMNIPVITGDATEAETLRQAGISNARAVIAVVNDDLTNMEIAIASQTLEPQIRVVLRIFDDEIDKRLDAQLNNGASFSTSHLAAPTLAAATLYRGIEYVLPRNGAADQLATARLSVTPDGPLASAIGRSVEEFESAHQVRLLKAMAGGSFPRVLPANVELHALGRLADVGALAQAAHGRIVQAGGEPTDQARVIVCGLGKVGYRAVTELSGAASHPEVIALDTNGEDAPFAAKVAGLARVSIEAGDGAKADDLETRGVDQAVAVAALTSDDLNNIKIALAARQRRPDIHVVVRVFNDVLAQRLRALFGIHTAYSTSRLAAPTFAAAALLPGAECALKADFTAEEWELLRKAPLIMAAAVIVSDLSGSVGIAREFLSMAQAVEETGQHPEPNELIASLVADLQAPQGEHAEETEDITDISEARAKALAETREIAALLARKSPPDEAEGFKRWMLSIAERVSKAAREGGVLGIGSRLVSEKETTMIDELAGALGIDIARPD